jgi:hypothetical protein
MLITPPPPIAMKNALLMCRHTFQYLKINLSKKYCSEHLGINIKLILYTALIKSITVYACATWEYVVDACLLKLQCLQN